MYITSIMVSIGSSIIFAGLVYILLVKKMHKERSSEVVTEEIRSEIDRMIVDLNQTADRNIGLIEQRIHSLGDTIKEADHRISLLQKHADNLTRSTDTYSRIRPHNITAARAEPEARPATRAESAPENEAAQNSAQNSAPQNPASQPPRTEEPSTAGGQSKRERVISLHRQGFSPDIIASRVDSTVAEVELIITMTEGQQ